MSNNYDLGLFNVKANNGIFFVTDNNYGQNRRDGLSKIIVFDRKWGQFKVPVHNCDFKRSKLQSKVMILDGLK